LIFYIYHDEIHNMIKKLNGQENKQVGA